MGTNNKALTEEQKRDSIQSDFERNFFVEAGAGAGKTTLIVERITKQIKTGIHPENLVVITFTNKAAQELKERIMKKIHEELKVYKEGTKEYKNLKYAEDNIERMQISTIHSFCHRMLTEQAFLAKLPLDVEVLEDAEEQKRFFDSQYVKLDKDVLQRLKDNYEGNAKRAIESVFLAICELPEDTEIVYHKELLDKTKKDYEAEAQKRYLAFCQDIIDTLGNYTQKTFQSMDDVKMQSTFTKVFCQKPINAAEKIKKGMNIFLAKKENGLANKADAESVSNLVWNNATATNLIALAKEYKSYQHALVVEVAEEIRNQYWAEREKGVSSIGNDALLQRARRLVCENKEAWEYFSNKYSCIYVDEFQDTDHVQADMILRLCRKKFDTETLRDGSLFVVGDAKQSIYRFRGADLHTYQKIKAFAQKKENFYVFDLQNNYRSSEKIVQWVNQEFQQKMGGNYQPMTAAGKRNSGSEGDKPCLEGVYYVESMNTATSIPTTGKSTRTKNTYDEIPELCALIKNLVGNYTIWDKDKKDYRDIQYADFLILCDKTKDMEEYVNAFQQNGIPVNLSGNADISKDSVLKRFANLYRYLVYPYKDRYAKEGAMQEVLRTLVGEEKVFHIDEKMKEIPECIQESKAKKRLEQLRNETKELSGSALALYLLHHLEYILDWNRELSSNELMMAQKNLYQMVEQVLSQNPDSSQVLEQAFFSYLEEPVTNELSLSYGENAVRFMNVHKAKGLEGHIVILAKRTVVKEREMEFQKETNNSEWKNRGITHEYYPACSTGEYSSAVGYQMDKTIWDLAKTEEQEEKIRLEYVAATRAMDALIVMSPLTKSKCFFENYGNNGNNTAIAGNTTVVEKDITSVQKDILTLHFDADSDSSKDTCQEYDKTRWNHNPEEAQCKQQYIDICPSALEFTVSMDENNRIPEDRPDGNVFGTVMHRAYELLIQSWKQSGGKRIEEMGESITPSVLQAIMESMDEIENKEEGKLEESIQRYREYLENRLNKFILDEDIQELLENSAEVYTELPFSIWTSLNQDKKLFDTMKEYLIKKEMMPEENQSVWIHGIADLVCRRKDGEVWIVDYKSDKKGKESDEEFAIRLRDRYCGQLTLYQCVMEKLFPEAKKVKFMVYHLYEKRKQ